MTDIEAYSERVPASLPRKFGLRVLALYVVLFFFPSPLAVLPFTDALAQHFTMTSLSAVAWIGERALGMGPIAVVDSPCGDSLVEYLRAGMFAACALAIGLVWASLDSPLARERRLWHWLRLYARYVLGFAMLSYGIHKIFPIQFAERGPLTLESRIGDNTLMSLYWATMSAAPMYAFFGGAAEVLGGVLLLFRRTTLLGALLVLGVMSNVVALNLSYDICVKLVSTHYLALALLLLAPDARWLLTALTSRSSDPPHAAGRARHAALAVKALLVAGALWTGTRAVMGAYASGRIGPPKSELTGAWYVDAYERKDSEGSTCEAELDRWKFLQLDYGNFLARAANGESIAYAYAYDAASRTLELKDRQTGAVQKLRVTGASPRLTLEDASGAGELRLEIRKKTAYALENDRIDLVRTDP